MLRVCKTHIHTHPYTSIHETSAYTHTYYIYKHPYINTDLPREGDFRDEVGAHRVVGRHDGDAGCVCVYAYVWVFFWGCVGVSR